MSSYSGALRLKGFWMYNMPVWVWSALNTNQPVEVWGQKNLEACKILGKLIVTTQINHWRLQYCLLFREGAYFLSMQSVGSQ